MSFSLLVADDNDWWSDYRKVAKYILIAYLEIALNVEKAVLRYCSRKVAELIPFISKLRRNWNRRSDEMQGMRIRL